MLIEAVMAYKPRLDELGVERKADLIAHKSLSEDHSEEWFAFQLQHLHQYGCAVI